MQVKALERRLLLALGSKEPAKRVGLALRTVSGQRDRQAVEPGGDLQLGRVALQGAGLDHGFEAAGDLLS